MGLPLCGLSEFSFQEFGDSYVGLQSVKATIEEFLLHPFFKDKRVFFYGWPRCVPLTRTFGVRGMIGCFLVGIWLLVGFHVFLWALILKTFRNYSIGLCFGGLVILYALVFFHLFSIKVVFIKKNEKRD